MRNESEQAKCQENPLIQAIKRCGAIEQRVLHLAIADLRPKLRNPNYCDEDFIFHMTTKELLDQFQGNTRILEERNDITGAYVIIGTAESHRIVSVFEEMSFSVEDGLSIQFNKDMREFILETEE